jgi:hypothetical protein
MTETIKNILYVAAAGAALLVGVFVLRGVFKLIWKIVRVGLILLVILLIAGYFFGFINLNNLPLIGNW